MGLFNLLKNTTEGVAEAAINAAKLAVSPALVVADDSAMEDAAEGIEKGIKKIGKVDDEGAGR